MKKSFLIAMSCLVLCVSSAQAQIHYGVKAGLNMATMDFEANIVGDIGSVTGFYAGAFVNMNLTDRLAVQPELLFSGQGYEYVDPEEGVDEVTKGHNTYLNLPIMLRYPVIDQLHLEAGPQIGFLMSSKSTLKSPSGDETEDTKHLYKSTDVGFNIGAGFHLPAGFAVELRYTLGLGNIGDEEELQEEGIESIKNRVLSFGLAYTIK